MDAALQAEIRRALETEDGWLLDLARRAMAESALVTETSDDQLVQLVHALRLILLEALEGRDDTRRLVIETAVPAYVEAGETTANLAGATVRFAVLLAGDLGERVAAEHRLGAVGWVASFYGTYACETFEAVEAAR